MRLLAVVSALVSRARAALESAEKFLAMLSAAAALPAEPTTLLPELPWAPLPSQGGELVFGVRMGDVDMLVRKEPSSADWFWTAQDVRTGDPLDIGTGYGTQAEATRAAMDWLRLYAAPAASAA